MGAVVAFERVSQTTLEQCVSFETKELRALLSFYSQASASKVFNDYTIFTGASVMAKFGMYRTNEQGISYGCVVVEKGYSAVKKGVVLTASENGVVFCSSSNVQEITKQLTNKFLPQKAQLRCNPVG